MPPPSEIIVRASERRIDSLDSLRGIAALVVMSSHYLQAIPLELPPLMLAVGMKLAAMSVIFFFVLSGYVLAASFAGKLITYHEFAIRRIFRIYIPVSFSILIAYFLQSALSSRETYDSIFLREFWSTGADQIDLMSHLLLTGVSDNSIRLNTVIWSAIYEIRLSILIPIMAILINLGGIYSVVLSIIIGIVCTKVTYLRGGESALFATDAINALLLTLGYAQFFMWGIWLFLRGRTAWLLLNFRGERIAGLILTGLLLFVPWISKSTLTTALYAAPSIALIALAVNSNAFGTRLTHPLFLWFGKVSFSLYLLHMPILLALGYVGHWAGLPWGWSFIGALLMTFVASELFFQQIELRAISWGRSAAKFFNSTFKSSK